MQNANLMKLVLVRYEEICNCNNYQLIMIILHKLIATEIAVFRITKDNFSQHSCQVVRPQSTKVARNWKHFLWVFFSKNIANPL